MIEELEEFRLTQIERDSALWTKLKTHLEKRISIMREKNDGPLSEMQTATLRGQINMANEVLRAGQPPDKLIYD